MTAARASNTDTVQAAARPGVPRALVNAFIIAHLAVMAFCGFSILDPIREPVKTVLATYSARVGLWQSWNMFAPDPLRLNVHIEAEVELASGARRTWRFPELAHKFELARFRETRFQKWGIDHVRNQKFKFLARDAARYVAWIHSRTRDGAATGPLDTPLGGRPEQEANHAAGASGADAKGGLYDPPVRVVFKRRWTEIRGRGEGFEYPKDLQITWSPEREMIFYRYNVLTGKGESPARVLSPSAVPGLPNLGAPFDHESEAGSPPSSSAPDNDSREDAREASP